MCFKPDSQYAAGASVVSQVLDDAGIESISIPELRRQRPTNQIVEKCNDRDMT